MLRKLTTYVAHPVNYVGEVGPPLWQYFVRGRKALPQILEP